MCKRVLPVLLLAASACAAVAAPMALVDGVVATVGREPILQSDLMQDAGAKVQALRGSVTSQEQFNQEVEKALREALEMAIEYQLLYREAQTAGIEVPDAEVEKRMNVIRRDYESGEAFARALEEAGTTVSAFRERVRRQIMAATVGMGRRMQFEKEAVVTESDMAQYYQDNMGEFSHPARTRVRRIFLAAGGDAEERRQARAKLEALRGELDLGADFAELAKARSEGPEAQEGGLVGWVKAGDMVPELDTALGALETGGVSGVVETEFGFHLLKVEEREEAGVTSFERARQEIEPKLRKKFGDERYKKWMSTLRQRGNVRVFM